MAEEWRQVVGFPLHMISNEGRVFSWFSERYLRPGIGKNGYLRLNLGFGKTRNVHALVAEAFIGPRPKGHVVRHRDGDRSNPRLDNLEYGTYSENTCDSVKHGTHSGLSPEARRKSVRTKDRLYPGWRKRAFGRGEIAA